MTTLGYGMNVLGYGRAETRDPSRFYALVPPASNAPAATDAVVDVVVDKTSTPLSPKPFPWRNIAIGAGAVAVALLLLRR